MTTGRVWILMIASCNMSPATTSDTIPNPSSSSSPAMRRRLRAKQACTSCRSRRIRCNVTEAHPCFNCLSVGCTCEIIPSKRGRHKRRPKAIRQTPPAESEQQVRESILARGPETPIPDPLDQSSAVGYSHLDSPPNPPTTSPPQRPSRPLRGPPRDRQDVITPSATSDAGTTPSSNLINGGMFFGESNALTCVASEEQPGPAYASASDSSVRLKPRYYPVPRSPEAADARKEIANSERTLKEQLLRHQGALDVPSQEQYTPVLRAYFEWFHPCFPVIDKAEFSRAYLENSISPLLLNALLFVGVTYSDEKAVWGLGYSDLGEAKSQLYKKTKLLFEADWETNSLVVLQALFLLTFLRAPMSYIKGHRYWLSAAINLAHIHGLHRASPSPSSLSSTSTSSSATHSHAKLRRRIWWSIYVRDIQSSVSLGLPARVREEDCDVPMLSPSDLDDDAVPDVSWLADPPTREQVTYAAYVPRLMSLLSRIASHFFAPRPSSPDEQLSSREDFMSSIESWKGDLPAGMQTVGAGGGPPNMWTCLLHLAYNHLIILLYRDDFMNRRPSGQNAIQASRRVTQIAEDMLAEGMIKHSQLSLITSVFAALCIHTIHLQRSQGVARRLGENRAKICLLALKEAQKSWDINNDILDLFLQQVEGNLAEEFQKEVADYAVRTTARTDTNDGGHGATASSAVASSEHPGANAVPDLGNDAREATGPSQQEGVPGTLNPFNDLGSQIDDFMPFFSPGIDFCVGEDMGIREFDSLQRWF